MPNLLSALWRRWFSAIGLALVGLAIAPLLAWGQISPLLRDQFLADPQFSEPRDPLLPDLPVERPLSPLEKSELRIQLNRLAVAAEALYQEGQTELAYEAWMREVRLRRILGYEEEIQALQRVGFQAWQDSRSLEVQLLTLRLQEIQADLLSQEPLNITLLEEVAASFEVLRDVDSAIAVYETLIARATQVGNQAERRRLLANLASLQESWFRFAAAAQTYQILLNALGPQGNLVQRVQSLQGAIRNYQAAGQLRTALDYQNRLLRLYQETRQVQPIPALTLAIAHNHRALENLEQARSFYQTTYSAALAQTQTDIAQSAVQELADIYLSLEQFEDALYLYRQKLAIARQTYDAYTLMQTYGQIGQLYEVQENPDAAIKAYQEGLILARHLNYREPYFAIRLQQLLFEQNRLAVNPAEQHQGSAVRPLQNPAAWRENQRALGGR